MRVDQILKELEIDIDEILFSNYNVGNLFDYKVNYLTYDKIDGKKVVTYDLLPLYIKTIFEDIDYDFKRLTQKQSFHIRIYFSFLYKYCKENPELMFSNPLLKEKEEVIIHFLGKDKLEELKQLSKKTTDKAIFIYKNIIKNDKFTYKKDLYFLIKYFINNIDTKDQSLIEAQSNLIKIIVQRNLDDSLLTKEFIMKFLAQRKFDEMGFNFRIYFSDTIEKNHLGETGFYEIQINAQKFKKVPLDSLRYKNYLPHRGKKVSMFDFIVTIYHELWHLESLYKATQGSIDSHGLTQLEDFLIYSNKSKEEYRENYIYKISEIEAEISGYKGAIEFYEKYLPEELEEFIELYKREHTRNIIRQKSSIKKDETDNVFINEVFVVKCINEIIKSNPKFLNEYKVLNLLYNQEGNPLPFLELINNLKEKDYEFKKYLVPRIINNELSNLNIDEMGMEQCENIVLCMLDVAKNSIEGLNAINEFYDKDDLLNKNYKEILGQKLLIFLKIYSFFRKNKNHSNFNTNVIADCYIVFDEYIAKFMDMMFVVGTNLNDEEIKNISLDMLSGDKKSLT